MGLIGDFVYRARQIVGMEYGVVEKLEPLPRCCTGELSNFSQSANEIPVRVTFRNPLGDSVERICKDDWAIAKYDLGDNYP